MATSGKEISKVYLNNFIDTMNGIFIFSRTMLILEVKG